MAKAEFVEIWVQFNWLPPTPTNPQGAALLGRKERGGFAHLVYALTQQQAEAIGPALSSEERVPCMMTTPTT